MHIDSALIADFILAKKARLRRLNVMTCDGSLALLDVLPQLPRLEVLGLDLWTWDWGAEHHQRLDAGLPRGLTALLIWDGIAECAVSKDEWVRLVRPLLPQTLQAQAQIGLLLFVLFVYVSS